MKKTLSILILFAFFFASSQETEFKYKDKKLPEYIVNEFDTSLTSAEIYNRALNWIKSTFKNPNEVLVTSIENEMIKFKGACVDCITASKSESRTAIYTITLYFKDGKYKMELNDYYYQTPTLFKFPLNDISGFYKKDMLIKEANGIPEQSERIINDVNYTLDYYVKNNKKIGKNDNW